MKLVQTFLFGDCILLVRIMIVCERISFVILVIHIIRAIFQLPKLMFLPHTCYRVAILYVTNTKYKSIGCGTSLVGLDKKLSNLSAITNKICNSCVPHDVIRFLIGFAERAVLSLKCANGMYFVRKKRTCALVNVFYIDFIHSGIRIRITN